jgi:hypothetical protein
MVSYFRLNRALPLAPRGTFPEAEAEVGRLAYGYLSVAGHYDEGEIEPIGSDPARHCYVDAVEINAPERQPPIGSIINASLFVARHRVLTVRSRVELRRPGSRVRLPGGSYLGFPYLPYERAFGCERTPNG